MMWLTAPRDRVDIGGLEAEDWLSTSLGVGDFPPRSKVGTAGSSDMRRLVSVSVLKIRGKMVEFLVFFKLKFDILQS